MRKSCREIIKALIQETYNAGLCKPYSCIGALLGAQQGQKKIVDTESLIAAGL